MTSPLKIDEAPWSPIGEYEKLDNNSHSGVVEHGGEEPWLLSYADMVTLLMCFFILFFSTNKGNINIKDPARLMEQMQALEKMLGIENDMLPESDKFEYAKTSFDLQNLSSAMGKENAFPANARNLIHSIGVPRPGILEITLLQDFFFASGTTKLSKKAEVVIDEIVKKLGKNLNGIVLEVEGHTDSSPTKGKSATSNWDLSGRRAANVVEYLEKIGLPPNKLFFRAYGHQRPMMPETDNAGKRIEKNMAVNRRVVIRVMDEGSFEKVDSK